MGRGGMKGGDGLNNLIKLTSNDAAEEKCASFVWMLHYLVTDWPRLCIISPPRCVPTGDERETGTEGCL